jgi:predicted O-methyltransferase YrrM
MKAIELAASKGMMSVGEVQKLQALAKELPKGAIVVNIGAGVGTSALAILEARRDVKLTTVDKSSSSLYAERQALSGIAGKRYKQLQGDSIRAGSGWEGGPIDLLFVDGNHSYDYVRSELEAWEPHLTSGATIVFHDYGTGHPAWEAVKRAADEWRAKFNLELYLRERIMAAIKFPVWGRDLKKHPLSYYVDRLQRGERLGFARYGDGEWLAILSYLDRRNSNGCIFTPKLRDALREVLRNNRPYEHAILRIARRKLAREIGAFLEREKIEVEWTIGDMLLDESLAGNLWPLIDQIRRRTVVYIGPPHLRGINDTFFRIARYVEVPPRDAIEERERIVSEALDAIETTGADFLGISSGLHAKVFIDDIWSASNVSIMDFGSMFDGYFNVKSRSYIRKGRLDWDRLRSQNTDGRAP